AARAGDTAPEGMRSAAAQTLPEDTKETSAVVLYDEKIIVVKENGDIEVTQRHVCKLLRADAKDECGYAVVHFDNETKVTAFRAWTIMASGGQMQVKDKEAAEVSLAGDFEVFSDKRAKIIKFPEANVGSVVGYEYTQKHRPFVFEDWWDVQRTQPTRFARFSLTLPPGWEYKNSWANFPDQKPVSSSGNQTVWEVRDVPAIEEEPEMPPYQAIAARMQINFVSNNAALRAKGTSSWD